MLSGMGVQFLQPLMDGADSENFKVCKTTRMDLPSFLRDIAVPGKSASRQLSWLWTRSPDFNKLTTFSRPFWQHGCSKNCNGDLKTRPYVIYKTIQAAVDYARPKYANFGIFHKKDALADNRKPRDFVNDIEPLTLLMDRRLKRGDSRWIECVIAPYNSELGLTSPSTLDVLSLVPLGCHPPPASRPLISFTRGHLALREYALAAHDDSPHLSSPVRRCAVDVRLFDFFLCPLIIGFLSFKLQRMYDGCKNILCIHKLDFATGSQEFDVTLADRSPSATPKVYQITLNLVAEINPEGKLSQDNTVLTVIMAFNVVIRMQPSLSRRHLHRHGVQGFDLGPPLRLWLDIIKKDNPLPPTHSLREQLRLQPLISSIRILTTHNKSLQFPYVIRAEIGSGALIPLELCVRQFGMDVNCAMRPLKTPGDGACNMVDKKFFKAVAIERWVVVVYEQQRRFNDKSVQDVICIKLAPTPCVDIDRWRSRRQPGPPPNRPEAHHLLSRQRFRGSIQAGFGASFVRTMWSGNPLKRRIFDLVLVHLLFILVCPSLRSRVSFPPSETTGA
ncbi:hypothetical protein K438DRAFT_1774895 [Mycena galopus ATCC 62051]|nr:hypothetical protein K438DRAFT_1774895 [Mycena galopus ATCC 62051]